VELAGRLHDEVRSLLDEDSSGADALPLLALVLGCLYRRRDDDGTLTLGQYNRLGGIRDVVNSEIDEVLVGDVHGPERALALLRSAFIPWLVTINPEDNKPMRRLARDSELPGDARPLIDKLVYRRLLTRYDDGRGNTFVEVESEAMFEHWDDLKTWLRDFEADLRTVLDIECRAAEWENRRNPDSLLTRTRLADAEMLAESAQFGHALAHVREYLVASRQAEDARIAAEEEERSGRLIREIELVKRSSRGRFNWRRRGRKSEAG
jgi:hypothetical protein